MRFFKSSTVGIQSLRKRPVIEFIDDKSKSPSDALIVRSDASIKEVLEKILSPENRVDAVVVVEHLSESPVLGTISDMDCLHYELQTMNQDSNHKPNVTALDIANKVCDFFYVTKDMLLDEAITIMNEKGTEHVVVLDNETDKNFVGWVTRRSISRKIGLELAE